MPQATNRSLISPTVVVLLAACSASLACSGDADPSDSPGSSGSSAVGGAGSGGTSATAGASTAGSSGSSSGGSGGAPAAGGGGAGTAGGAAGSGGASGGSAGAAGLSGSGGGGSGGSAGSAGNSSGGGAGTGGTSNGSGDCNGVTGQPIIEVAKDGSGDYTTVQAALNSLSKSNTTPTQIRIAPGEYKEKLVVQVPHVTLCGQAGKAASTVLTYSDNANTSNGSGGTLGTTGSASTNISASDVSAENITFANSTPLGGSQAVALLVSGSRVQFRGCRFLSYQDTLYTKSGSQYFKGCYVEGSVDYIFGGATAVFDECTVHTAAGGSAVTAPSTEQTVGYGLVFLGGELTAASSVSKGSQALGRNWRPYGAAAYIGTKLGAHISGVGWVPMGENTLDTARFSEYQSTGAGANPGARSSKSTQLSAGQAAAYTVDNILGSWDPSFAE